MSATYFLDMNGYVLEENSELPDIFEQAASGAVDRHRLVQLLRPYIAAIEELKQIQENYEAFDPADYIVNPVTLARLQAGTTQEELAELMNVTQAYVIKIENQEKVTSRIMQEVTKAVTKK